MTATKTTTSASANAGTAATSTAATLEEAFTRITPRGEVEIIAAAPLLDERGQLRYRGFATSLLPEYRRADIRVANFRIKEWDYYLVNDGDFAVALTLSDLGYAGMLSASLMDFRTHEYTTTSELVWFSLGKFGLPERSGEGVSAWKTKRTEMRFEALPANPATGEGARRTLSCTFRRFRGEETLAFTGVLDEVPADTMVIATPWPDAPKAFYYNQKIVAMRANAHVTVGVQDETGAFGPDAFSHEFAPRTSFGLLDWGRGVWTHDNTWYWGVAQGWQDGRGSNSPDAPGAHRFGMNIGYGFGDTTASSENMVFVDGRAHKLGRLDFGIPAKADGVIGRAPTKTVADRYRLMEPWHIRDEEGRLDLVFTPDLDRCDWMNFGVLITDQHQCFGLFNGHVVLDDGTRFAVKDLRGSAEVVRNKY